MPAIIGPVNIGSAGGIVTFGDVFYISPKETAKSTHGSGASNIGNFIITNNGFSATNTIDPDVADQNTVANA